VRYVRGESAKYWYLKSTYACDIQVCIWSMTENHESHSQLEYPVIQGSPSIQRPLYKGLNGLPTPLERKKK